MADEPRCDRRAMLVTTAGLVTTSLAGCSGSSDDTASAEFDGWFDGVSNYDGVADETGGSDVAVTVGAKGNGGAFAFAPAAVRVPSGTTVVWKWNGKGSLHNVVADDGRFESEMMSAAGETFTYTFERKETCKYYCGPHETAGMRGAVVVE